MRNSASWKPAKRDSTLSQNGAGWASITAISLTRKYSSTAFFSHSLTVQPPCPSGSATRNCPLSSPSTTRVTMARVEPSISSMVSVARRSNALSMPSLSSSLPTCVAALCTACSAIGSFFAAAAFFAAGAATTLVGCLATRGAAEVAVLAPVFFATVFGLAASDAAVFLPTAPAAAPCLPTPTPGLESAAAGTLAALPLGAFARLDAALVVVVALCLGAVFLLVAMEGLRSC
ncbi:membrane hypothetical protein [Xanthomonas citri pv. fuscans]|nr:membrane hypothetical protein [Xanthomonas citri pv. fuscans]